MNRDATSPRLVHGTPGTDDFSALLQQQGLYPRAGAQVSGPAVSTAGAAATQTQATTILAFKYAEGVLVAGDRRATAGHTIMYDRADKVLEIDRHSLMAIAGVPATAWEMARVLEHSFHYFRRTQLAEMSLEGKVRALSKLLRDNLGFVLQGVGVVVPIFATYDSAAGVPRMYFYDPMGAQFEAAEYAATGSGSPAVRAVLHYENSYAKRPLRKLKANEAVLLALRALDTAAESDAATGGVDRHARVFPIVKMITADGITTLPEARLAKMYRGNLSV
jgi:proteasome beta subunit